MGSLEKYGYFSKDGKEFIITRPDTPTPWVNYISNGKYCGLITNTGGGFSFYKSTLDTRITRWRPEGLPFDRPGRYIYIRDSETGEYWSLGWAPVQKELDFYECRHGVGYTKITTEYKGIRAEVLYFVPQGKDNLEIWHINLKNKENKKRAIDVFLYSEFCVGNALDDIVWKNEQHFNFAKFEDGTIYANRSFDKEPDYGFLSTDLDVDDYDCDRERFIGIYNSEANPKGVIRGKCSNSPLLSGNMIGAMRSRIEIDGDGSKEFLGLLGYGENKNKARQLTKKYQNVSLAKEKFKELKNFYDGMLNKNTIEVPDENMNIMVNVWNKMQVKILFELSRAASSYQWGFYEGIGYRDTAQDNYGYLLINHEQVKDKIKLLAKFQFKDGTAYHTFFDVTGKGMITGHTDDHLWLAMAVAYYINETGDIKFLDEKVKYVDGEPATMYEHCVRAIDYTISHKGTHGLPLIGEADWNDCLNAGQGGKGESVLLAQLLCYILKMMAPICKIYERNEDAVRFLEEAEKTKKLVNDTCWDGKWYIRAYTDDGTVIGSSKSEYGKIYIMTQNWAIISGIAEGERAKTCMESAREMLDTKWGPKITTPPYAKWDDRIGTATMCVMGKKENGAIFSHPITWAIIAECILGRADVAYDYYSKTLPMNPERDFDVFRTEPYTYPEFVVAESHPDFGMGSHSWMTGCGPWFLRGAYDYILGIRPTLDGLVIDPCIPAKWKSYKMKREFRNAVYEINIKNPDNVSKGIKKIVIDGEEFEGNVLPIFSDGKIHKVEVTMGVLKTKKCLL